MQFDRFSIYVKLRDVYLRSPDKRSNVFFKIKIGTSYAVLFLNLERSSSIDFFTVPGFEPRPPLRNGALTERSARFSTILLSCDKRLQFVATNDSGWKNRTSPMTSLWGL